MRPWVIGIGMLLAGSAIWLLVPPTETLRTRTDAGSARERSAGAPTLAAGGDQATPADTQHGAWTDLLARLRTSEDARAGELLFDEVMKRHRKSPFTLAELLELALLPAKEAYSSWGTWARQELAERRAETVPHLPRVLRLLAHDDKAQREAAALTIGQFAPLDAAHVPLMVAAFKRKPMDYRVGRNLVNAMEGMGAEIRPLAPYLVRFVEEEFLSRNETERGFSGGTSWDHVEYLIDDRLAVLGADAIPPLLEALERQVAARKEAVEEDGASLRPVMWDPASWCVRALRELGADSVPTLLALMRHEDADVRSDAADVLAGLKLARADIRLHLEEDLRAPDTETRRSAVDVLRTQGQAAVPALMRTLSDDDAGVRRTAATSLAELGVAPEAALTPLIEVVKGPNKFKALDAARTIARWGPKAAPALPALARAFRGDAWHDMRLSRLLANLAVHDTTVLSDAWADGSRVVRAGVVQTIGWLEVVEPRLHDVLARAVESDDLATRVYAAAALARHGHRVHLGVLAEGLRSDIEGLPTAAASGLAHYGAEARVLLPKLVERMAQQSSSSGWHEDEDGALTEAVAAIGAFDLDHMQSLLVHESIDVKMAAVYAYQRAGLRGLAQMEQAWPDAEPVLREEMLAVATGLLRKEGVDDRVRDGAWRLVVRASTDTAAEVRRSSCYQLAREVGRRPEALGLLVARIGDASNEVAITAGYLVKELGKEAAPARAELTRYRDHSDPDARRYVRGVLDVLDK